MSLYFSGPRVGVRVPLCAAPFVVFVYGVYWTLAIPVLIIWATILLTLWLLRTVPVIVRELPGAYRRVGYLAGRFQSWRHRRALPAYTPRHAKEVAS